MNKSFFLDTSNMIEHKLYINDHWMIPYIVSVFNQLDGHNHRTKINIHYYGEMFLKSIYLKLPWNVAWMVLWNIKNPKMVHKKVYDFVMLIRNKKIARNTG